MSTPRRTPRSILDSIAQRYSWGSDSGQAAGLLLIASALDEKNRIELMRLKFDVATHQDVKTDTRHQLYAELVSDLSTPTD